MIRKKVVIVEDNPLTSAMLKEVIELREDWEVVGTPGDAEKGADLILRTSPDLVLLDLIMTPCDGFVVLENVRRNNLACKFLVLSSVTDENMILKAMSMGASYYMTKPFDAEILIERINNLLGNAGARPSAAKRAVKDRATLEWERNNDRWLYSLFIELGMPVTQSGFLYLRRGIGLTVDDPTLLSNITGRLYPAIAAQCGVNECIVERSMRAVLETAWQKGNPQCFNELFGCDKYLTIKPTNSEFMCMLTDKILMEFPRPNE